MASTPIASLPTAISLAGADYVLIDQSNGDGTFTTKRLSGAYLVNSINLNFILSLPTTPPSSPGVLWNNGGVISVSQ